MGFSRKFQRIQMLVRYSFNSVVHCFYLRSVKDAFGNLQTYALLFYCIYLAKIIFYYYFPQRMKGRLTTEIDTILQDLKKQNN